MPSTASVFPGHAPESAGSGCHCLDTDAEYFGHLMRRTDSFEKILILGKIEGKRRRR